MSPTWRARGDSGLLLRGLTCAAFSGSFPPVRRRTEGIRAERAASGRAGRDAFHDDAHRPGEDASAPAAALSAPTPARSPIPTRATGAERPT